MSEVNSTTTYLVRAFGWTILAVMTAFVINNFLTFGLDLPGASAAFSESGGGGIAWLQLAFYIVLIAAAFFYIQKSRSLNLRQDAAFISDINTVFIRCAFWVVLIVGIGDIIVSFMRVENLLEPLLGEELAGDLGKSQFRGKYFHMPLLLLGIVIGLFTRSLGFHWLALLIVAAELMIVFSRFIYSYEQAFMADLVRFWYGALFLFASAFTLLEEGHVRVDVFYANFKTKTKGLINAVGSITMGITLCWTILIVGMGSRSSVINSPIFSFEVTQSGFGLYVKYMMAGFLGVFAISMMIQFVSYLMEAVADYRDEPGRRELSVSSAH